MMNRANLTSLAILGLVILAVSLTSNGRENAGTEPLTVAEASDRSSQISRGQKTTSIARTPSGLVQISAPHSSSQVSLQTRIPSENQRPARALRARAQRILKRDEQDLTFEVLADGTELIHSNGTNGHLSAASIGADGDVVVNCHSSVASLESQDQALLDPNTEEQVR